MPVVSSQYWNSVHGNSPDEVRRDEEGLQIMRTLGRNMAWLLKCIEAGRAAGGGTALCRSAAYPRILSAEISRGGADSSRFLGERDTG